MEPLIRGFPNGNSCIFLGAFRKEGERPELKHLRRGRRRNQIEMLLVTASEHSKAQTESPKGEMWCSKTTF